MEQVKLYDTTLRDGMQGEGMSLSASEKARVVLALDKLGVQMIEAGFPSSNPKEVELFEQLAELDLRQTTLCTFGMTRRRDAAAAEDPALRERLCAGGRTTAAAISADAFNAEVAEAHEEAARTAPAVL